VSCMFAAFIVVLLGWVYLKAKNDLTIRSDRMIASQMGFFTHLSPERRLDAIDEDLKQDPGRVQVIALFGPDGGRIAGNLVHPSRDLGADDVIQTTVVNRADERGRKIQAVRLIARRLPKGDVLVTGRNVDEVGKIARVLEGALALGLVPVVLLCLSVGWGAEYAWP
jgi:hypothetical protein